MIEIRALKSQTCPSGQPDLWKDEQGATLTIELILMATVIGLGAIVGLAVFRDAVSQEFGDASAGLASIDHGYQYNEIAKIDRIDNMRFDLTVSGSTYVDESNYCEPTTLDPVDDAPMCMQFSAAMIQDEG